MNPFILKVLNWLLVYKYWVAYPLAVAEGPILMVACGFLLRLGYLRFWPIYLVLIAGDFTGDIVWYLIGRFGARHLIKKWGKYLSLDEKTVERIERMFHKHGSKILIISKLTMGFGLALGVLITAGIVKVPFKKYLILNFTGQFVWTGLLLLLGYFFGHAFTLVQRGFRLAFVASCLVVLTAAIYGGGKYLKNRVLKNSTC